MKIVIISFDEPFFIPLLFKPLLKSHPELISGVIIVPQNTSKKGIVNFVKVQLSLMGYIGFAVKSFEYLIAIGEALVGITDKTLALMVKKRNIPLFFTKGVNDKKSVEILEKIKPDYVITQVPEKIEERVLKLANLGFINKHASLLPAYKGLYPIFWALLNDEKEIGFTFHFMNKNIDKGDIIYQEKIEVQRGDSVYSLYKKIFSRAGSALVNLVQNLNKKKINSKKMGSGGSYYSLPQKSDMNKFRKKGLKFV